MAIMQVSDGNPLGVSLGQSGDVISFFGATATGQQVSVTAVSSTAVASVSATQWTFSTSTQGDALVACVRAIHANLIAFNLLRSS